MKKSYYSFFIILLFSFPATAQIDYNSQVQSIFNSRCINCHGSNGGVDLGSFEKLMGSTGTNYGNRVIVANEPDSSGLVDKIEANPMFGNRMPQGGTLTQDQINTIRQWISEGANKVITSTEGEITDPSEFKLIGNFPNPFNPSTQIQFQVPQAVQYTISIFTAHGQLVAEQVGNASAGRVQVPVNLATSPTGMYFYKVTAIQNGNSVLIGSGKMTLIK